MPATSRPASPAVARAVALLDYLSRQDGPRRLSEISTALDLPLSSTSSICATLEAEAMVVRTDRGFRLGLRVVEIAHGFLQGVDPVAEFSSAVAELTTLRHHTAQMAILDGDDVLYIARRDGDQPFRISSSVGKRLPASCTAIGKAALALGHEGPPPLPSDLPALTPHSITDPGALGEELARVRQRGYAIDAEETSIGIVCFAVATQSDEGPATGVGATILAANRTPELEAALVADLDAVVNRLWPTVSGPLPPTSTSRPPSEDQGS